jgi:hypothetical protein
LLVFGGDTSVVVFVTCEGGDNIYLNK